MRFTLLVATLGLFALGCRGSDNPMGDDAPPVDAPPGTTEVTIQEIQSDAIAPNTPVKLEGVVVTGVDTYGARTGEFYVQEPEGGAYSGVKVFNAPLDQVAALAVGDVVTITNAVKVEYRYEPMEGSPFPEGQSLTELVPVEGGTMTVTKTGTGTTVTTDVDAAAIDMLATPEERDAEWEKWEGVLINVRKARQTSALTTFGAGADDQKAFKTTGRLEVQSAMTSLGDPVVDTCYSSLVGIGDYFFNYKLAPRSEADLMGGGTDCPLAFSPATITEIQNGGASGKVALTNVVVTAIDDVGTNKGFWIADAAQAAPFNGVYVYTSTQLPTYQVGQLVNVRGDVDEFDLGSMGNPATGDTITQIENATHMAATGTAIPLPVVVDVAVAGDITNGEPYEGVLITAQTMKVTNANVSGRVELTDNAGKKIEMDKSAFSFGTQTLDACLTVTGLGSVTIFDDRRTINPRSLADIVPATGCN